MNHSKSIEASLTCQMVFIMRKLKASNVEVPSPNFITQVVSPRRDVLQLLYSTQRASLSAVATTQATETGHGPCPASRKLLLGARRCAFGRLCNHRREWLRMIGPAKPTHDPPRFAMAGCQGCHVLVHHRWRAEMLQGTNIFPSIQILCCSFFVCDHALRVLLKSEEGLRWGVISVCSVVLACLTN
jgi:hypothetical protein